MPLRALLRRAVPGRVRYRLRRRPVRFGGLRRLVPVSKQFGYDRGTPIDRHYIAAFLRANAGAIRGRVIEVGDDRYIRAFGGDQVDSRDVLHVLPGQPGVTVVGDLVSGEGIPSGAFDCVICVLTLQMIADPRPAAASLHRMLRPGGTLLVASHGIARTARHEGRDPWGEYWHFTSQGLRRLLAEPFGAANVTVTPYGNVLAATAALHGLAAEELRPGELAFIDDDYEVIIGARAVGVG